MYVEKEKNIWSNLGMNSHAPSIDFQNPSSISRRTPILNRQENMRRKPAGSDIESIERNCKVEKKQQKAEVI